MSTTVTTEIFNTLDNKIDPNLKVCSGGGSAGN